MTANDKIFVSHFPKRKRCLAFYDPNLKKYSISSEVRFIFSRYVALVLPRNSKTKGFKHKLKVFKYEIITDQVILDELKAFDDFAKNLDDIEENVKIFRKARNK